MRSLCVFCGSSPGADARYLAAARDLGRALAAGGIRLVYGGASVGLMGAIADAVLEAGGDVVGVIPEALERREVAHRGLPDLRVVSSMHERKALMARRYRHPRRAVRGLDVGPARLPRQTVRHLQRGRLLHEPDGVLGSRGRRRLHAPRHPPDADCRRRPSASAESAALVPAAKRRKVEARAPRLADECP
jgi:hypothetical protein